MVFLVATGGSLLALADMTVIVVAAAVVVLGALLVLVIERRGGESGRVGTSDEEAPPEPVAKSPELDRLLGGAAEPAEPAPVEAAPEPEDKAVEPEPEPERTLEDGLARTRRDGFVARLGSLFARKSIDRDLTEEMEEVLFTADIGVRTAERLLDAVRGSLAGADLQDPEKIWRRLGEEARAILDDAHGGAPVRGTPAPGEPHVTLVLGVNGTGKTTTIGKMAHHLHAEGEKVALIAGDTFRAAAAEQLEIWAGRVDAKIYRGKEGADPASVVFDGVRGGLADRVDHILIDTAGRLHTQVNLMEELRKVYKVIGKAIPSAPHDVLLVLDATTGQNAIQQAKMFKDVTDVSGIVLTKLDGTAKGGVVIGICDELRIPIRYVGVGERVGDLRPFDAGEFVDALFGAKVPGETS